MTITRREALLFLASGLGVAALGTGTTEAAKPSDLKFQPLRGVMPLPTDGLTGAQQKNAYRQVEIRDELVLPDGYTYEVLASWGDRLGDSHFGYNNDYLSLVAAGSNQGYFLTVNFEYISARTWMQTYAQVMGQDLPFMELQKALQTGPIDAYSLASDHPLKAAIEKIAVAALGDLGIGVMTIRQEGNRWVKSPSVADRRISGISGWRDGNYLQATGPATLIFRKTQGQGYVDNLGINIIGTFGNCAGGTTPWGTVLSAEENFQYLVAEPVYSDGTSFPPGTRPFMIADGELAGHGSALGLAGNKYGWIVEVDPANPRDRGTKHTWLGRYRHEAVGIRVVAGKPLAFYSGCDRRGGHLYKFVSRDVVQNPRDKSNSRLLTQGMLYAAKFNADGTGRWIPLEPETPVNPDPPEVHAGGMITLPKRPAGGFMPVTKASEVEQFKQQYQKLGDLYTGSQAEKQGAILIDAHYAANAAGATCTARPEDTKIAPDGTLYIAFTSGSVSSQDGGPDERIFVGPYNQRSYEPGWIMALREQNGEPTAMTFTWEMVATGGEANLGGGGFSNPDNLMVDPAGNLWMVTDMSTSRMNNPAAIPGTGRFGNNSMWFIPTRGAQAGQAFLFAIGPMDCELTGPYLSDDRKTLFLAVQHPGEGGGIRQNGAKRTLTVRMVNQDGERFMQERVVPQGSNWPTGTPNAPPKPAVVAIRRLDGQPIA